jgi:RND family efflux transporter MFP subunit
MNMISQIDADDTPRHQRAIAGFRRLGTGRKVALIATPIALVAAAYGLAGHQTTATAAPSLPNVTVAVPLQRDVAEWDGYIGRFEASKSVEVRPRVSGQVTAIHFTDGEIVRKGQLLFTIDPRPFTAALAEAQANLASAKSDLALAKTDLDRAKRLLATQAVAQSEVDRLQARQQATVAAVAGAEARVRARALDVEFTQVRAPIAGRVSDRRIDAGNLVAAGEGTGSTLLTTINALDPIYFTFNGSEQLFLKARRAQQAGDKSSLVEIKLQDEGDYKWKGKLDFTDNGLDPHSGTIRGRATLANPGLFLTPGMFGNMRLASGATEKALLIPDTAVQTDQARKVVLVAGSDGTVTAKPVELGPVISGLRIVRSGLAANDRVIISGSQMAVPGAKVQAQTGQIAPDATPQTDSVSIPMASAASLVAR